MGESVLDLFTVYMSWLQEWSRRHGDWGMEMAASTAQKQSMSKKPLLRRNLNKQSLENLSKRQFSFKFTTRTNDDAFPVAVNE